MNVEQGKTSNNTKRLLPIVVEKFLNRRHYFEGLSKELYEESREYLLCQQRIESPKNILSACMVQVAHFGNRYDNVLVFEEINRLGYELIYADTDSIY